MSVSAALTLAPGCSPCRLRSALGGTSLAVTERGGGTDIRHAQVSAVIGVRSFFYRCAFVLSDCLVCAAHKDRSGISGLADAVPVDPACWEARSYCRAEAWLVAYELAVGELSARPAHRDFLPWWAAVGGCRLSAWPSRDVKPPSRRARGDKRFSPGQANAKTASHGQRAAPGHRGCHGRVRARLIQVRQTDSIGGTPWVT